MRQGEQEELGRAERMRAQARDLYNETAMKLKKRCQARIRRRLNDNLGTRNAPKLKEPEDG